MCVCLYVSLYLSAHKLWMSVAAELKFIGDICLYYERYVSNIMTCSNGNMFYLIFMDLDFHPERKHILLSNTLVKINWLSSQVYEHRLSFRPYASDTYEIIVCWYFVVIEHKLVRSHIMWQTSAAPWCACTGVSLCISRHGGWTTAIMWTYGRLRKAVRICLSRSQLTWHLLDLV